MLDAIGQLVDVREKLGRLLDELASEARAGGATWAQLAGALGVTP